MPKNDDLLSTKFSFILFWEELVELPIQVNHRIDCISPLAGVFYLVLTLLKDDPSCRLRTLSAFVTNSFIFSNTPILLTSSAPVHREQYDKPWYHE